MSKPSGQVFGQLRAIFHQGAMGSWTDGQLLERFAMGGEGKEVALEILIERHGPMVLGICRRTLNDPHDVEDAFQSTFLVLVRKANGLRDRDLVGHWLYGVACRIAAKSRFEGRRRAHPPVAVEPAAPESGTDAVRGERLAALDEEIGRLPEKYRAPVVLCYLQGLRHHEVAHQLGCPVGTVESRLSRARDRLRDRLTRRGLAPPLALALLAPPPTATVPPSLVSATVRAAGGLASSQALAVGASTFLALNASKAFLLGFAVLGVSAAGLSGIVFGVGRSPRDGDRPAAILERSVAQDIPARKTPQVAQSPVSMPDPPVEAPQPVPPTPPIMPTPPDLPIAPGTEAATVAVPPRPYDRTKGDPDLPIREASAVAGPLQGITVDGDLNDWPAAMPRHPLLKMVIINGALGSGGLREADLTTSPDLSVAFSVGYDPAEQLIYLAVTVRDDKLIVGNTSHLDTDALEVYIDGLNSEKRIPIPAAPWWQRINLADVPVQQYVAIPGPGKVYGTTYDTNPILLAGDLKKTKTRMAFRREGGVTTYEWAIQPFDRYPDRPTQLMPGKRIGFDLAVADRDVPARSPQRRNEPEADRLTTWIYWGPQWGGMKVLNAGNLGELILGNEP